MSKSLIVKNVRINSSTVQTVTFKKLKNGHVLCQSNGFAPFFVIFDSYDEDFFAVRPRELNFERTAIVGMVSSQTPEKAFAKAVKAFWS